MTDHLRQLRTARLWQIGEVAASLSHDLGQPLNVIRLTAESAMAALDQGRADSERLRRALATAVEQTGRMQAMMDALLAGTRRPTAPPAPFRPVEAVRRALRAALPRLKAQGIRLVWHADPRTPSVEGFPARLEMAVAEVLANACETLAAAQLDPGAAPPSLAVSCRAEAGEAVVAIEDNGPGFPSALRATLDAALPDTGGRRLGIGLAIALGVVAEMGGRASFADAAPGTRVELRLPAAAGPSVVLAGAAGPLADALGRRGWRVQAVEDTAAAVAQVARTTPQVVVAVGADAGPALARALRALAPDLPVVVLAAPGEDGRAAVAAGAALVLGQELPGDEIALELGELVNGILMR